MRMKIVIVALALSVWACTNRKWEEIKPKDPNVCYTPADTLGTITYTSDVQQILQVSCGSTDANCHSSATGSGGTILDTYADAATSAQSNMINSINGDAAFVQMPNTGTLSPCDKLKLIRWIHTGAQN